MCSLYILEIRPLSEVSLQIFFSHPVGSLCILMLFSLALQKLFILMRSHLFIDLRILYHPCIPGMNPTWSLLVGMQTGEATVENSMEFPQKTKNGTAL